jgi:hypothetical protein
MVDDFSLLTKSDFNLDSAVLLAKASQAAYLSDPGVSAFCTSLKFDTATTFNSADVQGYWCTGADVVLLVFRGTSNPGQWLRDVRFFPSMHPWGHVHKGFLDGVAAVETALSAFDKAATASSNVWITGHSLGGALAVIAAARLKTKGFAPRVYTFGQPAVGLGDFAERFGIELPQRLWRFVNQSDIVTRVPPGPLYRHTGVVKRIVRPGVLESIAAAEAAVITEAPVPLDTVNQMESARHVILGGAALTTATAIAQAAITRPRMIDVDVVPLTDVELAQLQFVLGAAGNESTQVEGVLPWFADHSISEYVRLLDEIRKA